ncbi:MAG: pyridoxamine 5'-phosphate oxidase [Alphaproteobacteria bacterium]|nr:pyridoxamine 5'-phosphate oxidase [Alphaproteobacteria bacterium]
MFTDHSDPYQLFKDWFAMASAAEPIYPEAVTLATAASGRQLMARPIARTVLLRGHDKDGYVFFSNSHSRKGQELAANPHAALLFYWRQPISRQIRIEGVVHATSEEESDAYFAGRPRDSQIGAWASLQSAPLSHRQELEQRMDQFAQQFAGQAVPRPPHWHGYRLHPQVYEFWQEQPARLHDRLVYSRDGYAGESAAWHRSLLYP